MISSGPASEDVGDKSFFCGGKSWLWSGSPLKPMINNR